MSGKRWQIGRGGKKDDAAVATVEESTELMRLMDALNVARDNSTRAQIALATAELDYTQHERKLAKKYKLNPGDMIGEDGTIKRKG